MRFVTPVLALIFLASGGAKLAGLDFEIQAFARWGYPIEFMYAVGVAEVAGGLALLVRRVSALAAVGLTALMVGAVATHVIHAEWGMLVLASGIMTLAAWRGWQDRHEIAGLLRRPVIA